jgi:TonB family protein
MTILRTQILFALLCAGVSFKALSQDVAAGTLPKDPEALLMLGQEKNGLSGSGVQPWHIRGHYTIYDEEGKPEDTGVYEEWWVSATRYKLSFTGTKYTQVDYATGKALFRDGSLDWLDGNIALRSRLINPIPDPPPGEFVPKAYAESADKLKFQCVSLTYPQRSGVVILNGAFPAYCFDSTIPVLRAAMGGTGTQTIYNNIVVFQGHYLARELQDHSIGGKIRFDLSLDLIETIAQVPDSFPDPPPTAKQVDLSAIFFSPDSSRFGMPQALKKAAPVYPILAKENGIQGTVVVKVTVKEDGHVDNLRAVSGPSGLQQAALDAAREWMYQPFVVLGVPRTVELEIKVIFTLG